MPQPPSNLPFADETHDVSGPPMSPSVVSTSSEPLRSSSVPPAPPRMDQIVVPTPPPNPPSSPEGASPKQIEDMFAGLEDAGGSAKKSARSAQDLIPHEPHSFVSTVAVILGVVVLVGLGVFGMWYVFVRRSVAVQMPSLPVVQSEGDIPSEALPADSDQGLVSEAVEQETITAPLPVTLPDPAVSPPPGIPVPDSSGSNAVNAPVSTTGARSGQTNVSGSADSDADGLSDERETQLGTDPMRADTDDDRLTDGQEVNRYETNPLISDSDRDTYSDGLEVERGFNPRGPGKCLKPDCTP